MQAEAVLVDEGATVRLPDHSPTLNESQRADANAFVTLLREKSNNPPTGQSIDPELLGL